MNASNWQDSAACATGYDADLWFPVGTTGNAANAQAEEAKAVCRTCPAVEACLRYALECQVDEGIYGGLTEQERRRIHRRKNGRAYPDRTA